MKRILGVAGIAAAATAGLVSLAGPASASGVVSKPADCALTSSAIYSTITYHLTCSARPTAEQWQIVISCNPRGANGADWFYYGNIVTGNGTSTGSCQLNSPAGYADVYFSNSDLQSPGRHS